MKDQMSSALVEIRAITRDQESLDAVFDMHRMVISMHERIVESAYVVRCTLSGVSGRGHQIGFIVNVRPIGPKPETELHYMLRRVCRHLKRLANQRNLGYTVSHSTYDMFVAKGNRNVQERKNETPSGIDLSERSQNPAPDARV